MKAKRWFDNLAAGGNVSKWRQETFWAHGFGKVTDKYGVPWMINVVKQQQNALGRISAAQQATAPVALAQLEAYGDCHRIPLQLFKLLQSRLNPNVTLMRQHEATFIVRPSTYANRHPRREKLSKTFNHNKALHCR